MTSKHVPLQLKLEVSRTAVIWRCFASQEGLYSHTLQSVLEAIAHMLIGAKLRMLSCERGRGRHF